MTGFDAKTYKTDVLKPNSSGEGYEQIRDVLTELHRDPATDIYARLDLNTLFAIPHPVTADQLENWFKGIVPALNKAEQALPSAKLLKSLLSAIQSQGKDVKSPAFWGALQAKRQQIVLGSLEERLQELRAEYPLDVVTIEELTARLATVGITGVTEGSVRSSAQKSGLQVHPKLTFPEGGMPSALAPIWKQVSRHSSFRSIFDLLLLHRPTDLREIAFVDGLSSAAGPIGLGDIEKSRTKSEQSKDTNELQDAQKFLGALLNHCTSETQLHEIVLAAVADGVSQQIARGKPLLGIRNDLVIDGFAHADASRIVAAIDADASSSVVGTRLGLDSVRQLLAAGQLAEAERTLASLAPADLDAAEYGVISALITAHVSRKSALLEKYRSELAARNFVAAGAAVREILQFDTGDDELSRLLDALPPDAPHQLVLRSDEAKLVLSWSQRAGENVSFSVIRAVGRVPAGVADGTVLASGHATPTFTDAAPPVATPLGYAVFASANGKLYSDPATAETVFLPAPSALVADADSTSFRVSWASPRGASGAVVSCTNPDGSTQEAEVPSGSTFELAGLQAGSTYRVAVRAVYLLEGGRRLSDPAVVTIVPRGKAAEVRDLRIEPSEQVGSNELTAGWSASEGFDVELWAFPVNAQLSEGLFAETGHLQRIGGSRISIRLGDGATTGRSEGRFATPREVVKIAPLTVVADGYLVGYAVLAGEAPSARDITTELFGSDLRVSWTWPEGDVNMELSWHDGARGRSRSVTRARYRAEGGVKLSDAPRISGLAIASVVRVSDGEWRSAPIAIPMDSPLAGTVARYSVRIKRALFSGKVSVLFTGTTEQPGHVMPVVAVLKRGTIMPLGPDDGQILARFELDFTSSTSVTHSIDAGKEKSPLWITLFPIAEGDRLDPPPTSEMKA